MTFAAAAAGIAALSDGSGLAQSSPFASAVDCRRFHMRRLSSAGQA